MKPALRRRSEIQYQKSLLGIVSQINQIVTGSYDGSQASADTVAAHLIDYSQVLDDWAAMVGQKMFLQVERESGTGGNRYHSRFPRASGCGRQYADRPGDTGYCLPANPVDEVPAAGSRRSRPKIQQRAIQATIHGERPDALYEMIMQSGDVAASRAKMIARTEIGRATGALTQARALAVGSEGYWWRIEGAGTRPSHKKCRISSCTGTTRRRWTV